MTTEARQVGLESATIKAIAQQARNEISEVGSEITRQKQPVEKAFANLQLIGRLSQLPGVRTFLQATEGKVVILGQGSVLGEANATMAVSTDGMNLEYWAQVNPPEGWSVTKKTYNSRKWERRLDINKEELEGLYNEQDPVGRKTVRRLAKLPPEKIVRKFEQAVSSPVNVS